MWTRVLCIWSLRCRFLRITSCLVEESLCRYFFFAFIFNRMLFCICVLQMCLCFYLKKYNLATCKRCGGSFVRKFEKCKRWRRNHCDESDQYFRKNVPQWNTEVLPAGFLFLFKICGSFFFNFLMTNKRPKDKKMRKAPKRKLKK